MQLLLINAYLSGDARAGKVMETPGRRVCGVELVKVTHSGKGHLREGHARGHLGQKYFYNVARKVLSEYE